MDRKTGCILMGVGLIVLAVVNTVIYGWALSLLWGWFIVPIFGLPFLTIPQAIGVSCVASIFKNVSNGDKDDSSSDKIARLVGSSIAPVFLVAFGWIVRGFI